MAKKYSEDYFEHTKMTFGEHLDELRRSLWKAVLALFLGFLIGLWFGQDIVQFIQTPLIESLKEYYQAKDVEKLALEFALENERDAPNEEDLAAAKRIVEEGEKVFEVRFLDEAELIRLVVGIMGELDPKLADEIKRLAPKATPGRYPEKFVRLRVYNDVDDDSRVLLQSLGVQEPFVVYIKASLVLGAVISSPFVFYFIWQFVAAGLFPHEKHYVFVFGPFSLALFLAGAALAYFAVIGFVLRFLFAFNAAMGIDPDPRISEWLSFVMLLPLGFGISFQLPLVMLFLERIGIMSVKTYIDKWRISVLIISILSMILTPADPQSMILMFVPLTILYFGGIALCYFWPKRKTPFGEEIDANVE
jgi:sec-independent protein translocase protein TatC